jgi:hypothetical protein
MPPVDERLVHNVVQLTKGTQSVDGPRRDPAHAAPAAARSGIGAGAAARAAARSGCDGAAGGTHPWCRREMSHILSGAWPRSLYFCAGGAWTSRMT